MAWELVLLGLGGGIIGLLWVLVVALWEETERPPQ